MPANDWMQTDLVRRNEDGTIQTKLNEDFIQAFKDTIMAGNDTEKEGEISEGKLAAMILTDKELVNLINDKLPEVKRISYRTWREYKSGNTMKDNPNMDELQRLIDVYKAKAKLGHYKQMMGQGAGNWQKTAWWMERKYDDLNLTKKVDHTTNGESLKEIKISNVFDDFEDADFEEVSDES